MKISPPAFPTWIVNDSMAHGMSLRDYFAAQAMIPVIENRYKDSSICIDDPFDAEIVAMLAYFIADGMIKVREE